MLQIYKVNYGDLCLLNADIQIHNKDDIYIITAKYLCLYYIPYFRSRQFSHTANYRKGSRTGC